MERDSAPHPRAPQGLPTVAPAGLIVRISSRRGMTLAELLIVLAILAITSVVALQAVAPLADQARIDATRQTLAVIRAALVGPPPGLDGTLSISGFVPDMGRLPQNLTELLLNPSNPTQIQSVDLNPYDNSQGSLSAASTVSVASGWNGPYLQVPAGMTWATATDGWGRAFNGPTMASYVANQIVLFPSTAGTYWTIWSSGMNGIDDSTAAGTIAGDDIPLVVTPNDYQATMVAISLVELNSSGVPSAPVLNPGDTLTAYLSTVNAGNVTNDQIVLSLSRDGLFPPFPAISLVPSQSSTSSPNLTFSGANIGTAVLQAVHSNSSGTVLKKSMPMVLTLRPQASISIPNFILQ